MSSRVITCQSCNHKIAKKEAKFSCAYCSKAMHMTPDCTGFEQSSIEVLVKLEANLLHICNECSENKTHKSILKPAEQSKLEDDLTDLREQMKKFQQIIENSNAMIENVKKDLTELKSTAPKSYAQAVGKLPGSTIRDVSNANNIPGLGFRIRGIPESRTKTPDERMHSDIESVEQILDFLKIKDKRMSKIHRLGKFDTDKKGARTILVCLMKFERRLKFSDCLSTRSYDILCLTETWLTPDVQNYSLFLPAYTIYRNDRIPCEHETKHGGVLIAIRSTIMHEQILIDLNLEDFVVISVQTKPQPTLICCLYSPPSDSDYTWSPQQLEILLSKISNHANRIGYQGVFICGDINFSKTDWNNMSSNSECENAVLDALSEYNFLNYSNLQLDVILANNPDQIVKTDLDTDLYNCYALNGKPCADHLPVSVTVNAFHSELYIHHQVKYAFKKADWDELNKAIVDSPFNPYCFSNLDFLVKKWYEWIFSLIDHFIPKVTRHRSTLPPWVSSRTSHLMKKLATKKKQWVSPVLSKLLKLKKMERQIKEARNEDLKMFETKIFQSRQFSNIQKYLRCVRKLPNVPPVVTLSTQKAETDQEKAKLFNQFFQSVFNEKQHHCITFENRGLNSLLFSEIQHILEH